LAALLVLAWNPAAAQTKPFKVTGGGVVAYVPFTLDTPVFHYAIGQATSLGRYYAAGEVQLDAFTSATTADFSSAVPCVFTAANGDRLAFTYGRTDNGAAGPGVVELIDAGGGEVITVWTAEFNPVPALCTGRFAKITGGSFIMVAMTDPFVFGSLDPVAYTWQGSGSVTYGKK
jgi:hypothetical protein